MTPFLVWLLGLALIYIEFYLPGAVMGTVGGILVVASVFLFHLEYDSPWLSILYTILVGISVALLIKYALWHIPKVKKSRSIYSNDAQDGFQASSYDTLAIGKTATVISDLKPGGYIEVDGKQHQAISESGYLVKGEKVLVVRGEGESLIVHSMSS